MLCPHSLRSFFYFPWLYAFLPSSQHLLLCWRTTLRLPKSTCLLHFVNQMPLERIHSPRLSDYRNSFAPGEDNSNVYFIPVLLTLLGSAELADENTQILMWEAFESPVLISSQAMPRLPSNGSHFRQQGSLFRAPYRI